MTPRERISALAVRLTEDAEKHHLAGVALLERANEELKIAASLRKVIPALSDADCSAIVSTWKDEEKAS